MNGRLVRVSAVLVLPALLALLFSVSPTGALPKPQLAPVFDPAAAASLASQLSTEYPSRIPGTFPAADAARWYRDTLATFGLHTEEQRWKEDLPGLGPVQLTNLVTVIPGRSSQTIVLVAHRDNQGVDSPFGNNASGTAALIELARGYAPQQSGPTPQPQHTVVLVSTDAGAYGGAGAAHFAANSPYARTAIAAVILDGLGGHGPPRVAIAGDTPSSPAPALVRTAVERIREQSGLAAALPAVPTQLVDLAIPYAAGEQGPFLSHDVAAVTLTSEDPGHSHIPAGDSPRPVSTRRLGQLGRAVEALVDSIDASVGAAFRTPDSIFLGGRVASGWAARLTLVVAVVPFALGVLDLAVRARRRRLPFRPALRALRARILFWLFGGVTVWLGSLTGILAAGAALPIPPYSDEVTSGSLAGLALLMLAFAGAWFFERRRLVPSQPVSAEERLAGYTVALCWLAFVAILVGIASPYALVFVLPSLYTWLWLPVQSRPWARASLFACGLLGPLAGLLVLANEIGLSPLRAALYVLDLVSVGYVSPLSALLALGWMAAAAQLAALAFGRYGPYAAGVEPPPPGIVRITIARLARRARNERPTPA